MHPSELDYERFLFGTINGTDAQDAADAYEDYRDDVDDVQDDPFFDDVPRVNGGRSRSKREDGLDGHADTEQGDAFLQQQQRHLHHQHQQQHQQQHQLQQRGRRGRLRASSRAILLEQRGVSATTPTPVGEHREDEPTASDGDEGGAPSTASKRRPRPAVSRARGKSRYAFMEDPLLAPPPTPSVEPTTSDPLPDTDFSCADKVAGGFYADTQVDCQLFHICSQAGNDKLQDNKFMCGPGTRFNQRSRTCQARELVDCNVSARYYNLNAHFSLPPPEEPVTVPPFDSLKMRSRKKRSSRDQRQRSSKQPEEAGTAFRCSEPGLFADVSSGCESFHVCHADPGGAPRLVSTQPCPAGTRFDQRGGACDAADLVACELLASADVGFGGVASRTRPRKGRSLAVLVGVVPEAAERRRRARRAAAPKQQAPLDFYYADYDAGPAPAPDTAPRHTAGAQPPPPSAYFRYSDAGAAESVVSPPAAASSTERKFNPDDYVDDNYEPFIEGPAEGKTSTLAAPTERGESGRLFAPAVGGSTAASFVADDRDPESGDREPPFAVASLRDSDPYEPPSPPSDGKTRPSPAMPQHTSDKDAAEAVRAALSEDLDVGHPDPSASSRPQPTPADTTTPLPSEATTTAATADSPTTPRATTTSPGTDGHRFRIGDGGNASTASRAAPTPSTAPPAGVVHPVPSSPSAAAPSAVGGPRGGSHGGPVAPRPTPAHPGIGARSSARAGRCASSTPTPPTADCSTTARRASPADSSWTSGSSARTAPSTSRKRTGARLASALPPTATPTSTWCRGGQPRTGRAALLHHHRRAAGTSLAPSGPVPAVPARVRAPYRCSPAKTQWFVSRVFSSYSCANVLTSVCVCVHV
ncbi:hypothetical protein ONE63_000979 [Megalurothrips usitatus]|uniref:Chitin-binding type-2 domain-containing protein n=1 Tax=Megalurothrips usitatus TaxID=439358 RepID=A0AAV7Y085_9NEOP|nr:hypothetical protein ONE63_000979 [Megalurothrips usitatus]